MRGQLELPALGIALFLLTVALVLAVTTANSALAGADRSPVERTTAVGVSDRLVSADAPLTARRNVLDADAVAALDSDDLSAQYGLPPDADVRVRLDGEVIASAGDAEGGTTVERLVLIESREERTIRPAFGGTTTMTLPRRSGNATLTITPPPGTTVRTVWANEHALLANDDGLAGTFELSLSPLETTQLRFEALGPLESDHVQVTFYPPETRKALLEVTVDG